MCVATPVKLIKIEGKKGFVENESKKKVVDLSLVEEPKKGDWLLVHGEMAIGKVDASEADEILKLAKQCQHSH